MSTTVSVKLFPPSGLPRRFQFHEHTYEALLHQVRETLGDGNSPADIVLTYVDNDGDHVRIATNADVQEAIRHSGTNGLKLYVNHHAQTNGSSGATAQSHATPASTSAQSSEETKTPAPSELYSLSTLAAMLGPLAGAYLGRSMPGTENQQTTPMQDNVLRFVLDCVRSNRVSEILSSTREAIGARDGHSLRSLVNAALRVASTDKQTSEYLQGLVARTGNAVDPWLQRNRNVVIPALSSLETLSRNVNTMEATKKFLATSALLFVPATLSYASDWARHAASSAQQYFTAPIIKAIQNFASDPSMERVASEVITPVLRAISNHTSAQHATIAPSPPVQILQKIASNALHAQEEKKQASQASGTNTQTATELSRLFHNFLQSLAQYNQTQTADSGGTSEHKDHATPASTSTAHSHTDEEKKTKLSSSTSSLSHSQPTTMTDGAAGTNQGHQLGEAYSDIDKSKANHADTNKSQHHQDQTKIYPEVQKSQDSNKSQKHGTEKVYPELPSAVANHKSAQQSQEQSQSTSSASNMSNQTSGTSADKLAAKHGIEDKDERKSGIAKQKSQP